MKRSLFLQRVHTTGVQYRLYVFYVKSWCWIICGWLVAIWLTSILVWSLESRHQWVDRLEPLLNTLIWLKTQIRILLSCETSLSVPTVRLCLYALTYHWNVDQSFHWLTYQFVLPNVFFSYSVHLILYASSCSAVFIRSYSAWTQFLADYCAEVLPSVYFSTFHQLWFSSRFLYHLFCFSEHLSH